MPARAKETLPDVGKFAACVESWLAPELLREALGVELPAYSDARIESADLPDVRPAAYHSDLVVSLVIRGGVPVHGIIVETQLQRRKKKRLVWPNYVTALRARHGIEVSLLVVTPKENVERWAREPIHLGGGNLFTPLVLGPSATPRITDEAEASARPELAVLSALAHGRDADTDQAARIAAAAEGLRVPFIGIEDLLKNKEAAGRSKDLIDLDELRRIVNRRPDQTGE